MRIIFLLTLSLIIGCSSEPEVRIVEKTVTVYEVIELGELSKSKQSLGYDSSGAVVKTIVTEYYQIVDSNFTLGRPYYHRNGDCWGMCDCVIELTWKVGVCSTTVDTICYQQKECE